MEQNIDSRNKQPKFPSKDNWVKNIYQVHSLIRKSKIMPFAAKWIDLENIILEK